MYLMYVDFVNTNTDMSGMFNGCNKFDCDLSGWNTSNNVWDTFCVP